MSGENTFKTNYKQGKLLGKGAFSKVYRVTEKKTNSVYAAKIMDKSIFQGKNKEMSESVLKEIGIMRELNHPNIVGIKDYIENKKELIIVMDLAEGGELFDRVISKGYYTEQDAADIVKQVLEACSYLHDVKKVVHRDIKPENILFKTEADDSSIMISDFGLSFAAAFASEDQMKTACGTPGYCAPEVLASKPYDEKVDTWSVGVVTYILLCGYPPFSFNENDQVLFKQIRQAQYKFDMPAWGPISDEAKNFISKLIITSPAVRLSAKDALKHPWIRGGAKKDNIAGNVNKNLERYQATMQWKKVMHVMKIYGALNSDTKNSSDQK